MTKKSGVSIIIPSHDNKKSLFRLLDSIKKSDYENFETKVVDNSLNKKILVEGSKKYKWVNWVDAGKRNIGWTGSYNLGFSKANKKNHLMMIDEDVVIEPSMISKLVERLNSSEKIGIVTPMILYLDDKSWVNQAGAEVNLWTGKVTIGWGPKEKFLIPRRVQNSGTVMIFKRELVNKIGGFEDWFMGYADPEYCLRALKVGYETWYEPKAVAYHDQSKDPDYYEPKVLSRAYLVGRNRTLFMRKYGKFLLAYILFLPLLFAYYFKTSMRYGIFPKFLELIKGTWDGFFAPLNTKLKIKL